MEPSETDVHEPNRFNQVRRILPVITCLMEGKSVGVAEIEAMTGFDTQQARRLLRFLIDEMHLKEERDGRRIVAFRPSEAKIGSPDQMGMVALELAASSMSIFRGIDIHRRWQEIAARATEAASERARQLHELLDRAVYFVRGPHTDVRRVDAALTIVLDSLVARERVQFGYRSSTGEGERSRRVEPWSLVVYSGRFYLLGPEVGGDRPKLWRLENMIGVRQIEGESYDYPSRYRYEPEDVFEHVFGVYVGDRRPEDVSVIVSGPVPLVDYADVTVWHRSERKQRTTAGLEIHMHLVITPELEQWMMGFGEYMTVIGPEHLAVKIRDRHAQAAKLST